MQNSIKLLEKFLSLKREYSDITDKDFDLLHTIIRAIIDDKWYRDEDGDSRITFDITNLTKEYDLCHPKVPHQIYNKSDKEFYQALDYLSSEADHLSNEVFKLIRIKYRQELDKEKKREEK